MEMMRRTNETSRGRWRGKKMRHHGGEPIQFRITKFDFESNLECRTTSVSN
jgi:hypothetical protein